MEDRCAKGALSRANLKKTISEVRVARCRAKFEVQAPARPPSRLTGRLRRSARTRRNPPHRACEFNFSLEQWGAASALFIR